MDEVTPIPADVLACPDGSFAATAWAKLVLSRFASYMAARYNGAVLLVGSSLREANPRDVDVRIVISDDEFRGRYGIDSHGWLRHGPPQPWVDDMAKRNAELAAKHHLNADFQVYPARHAVKYRDEPRVVLAAPSWLLANPTALEDAVRAHDAALSDQIASRPAPEP